MGFVPFTAIWKATGCPLRKGGTLVAFYKPHILWSKRWAHQYLSHFSFCHQVGIFLFYIAKLLFFLLFLSYNKFEYRVKRSKTIFG